MDPRRAELGKPTTDRRAIPANGPLRELVRYDPLKGSRDSYAWTDTGTREEGREGTYGGIAESVPKRTLRIVPEPMNGYLLCQRALDIFAQPEPFRLGRATTSRSRICSPHVMHRTDRSPAVSRTTGGRRPALGTHADRRQLVGVETRQKWACTAPAPMFAGRWPRGRKPKRSRLSVLSLDEKERGKGLEGDW
jgi:hypothetical protein